MKTAMRWLPVLFLCLSIPAMGQITGSKHDLRPSGGGASIPNQLAGLTEICLPCHIPHNSTNVVNIDSPLWNHELAPTAGFTHYVTLSGTTGDVTGASRLCLGCHDGNTAMDNYGGTTGGTIKMTGSASFGTDLSNDHPIGITYPTTGSYAAASSVKSAGLRLPSDGTNDRVECQSCHDPHKTTTPNFLRIDNDGSNLCKACHTL